MDWQGAGTVLALALGAGSSLGWILERRDRKAEIAMERERLDAELADRAASKVADITAVQGGSGPDGTGFRYYDFVLTNMGPSYAKHVTAWLVDADGTPCSNRNPGFPLPVGSESLPVRLRVPTDLPPERRPAHLMVGWFGQGGGAFEERSNLTLRLD